jgi:hypothetical protein
MAASHSPSVYDDTLQQTPGAGRTGSGNGQHWAGELQGMRDKIRD